MTQPTHEQGQLQLQIYDLRREAKLRQARDWLFQNYHVDTFDDSMRIAAPGTENGALAMMVFSYWEQACAFLNHGLLHEDLFFETSGEFFGVWELVKGIVPQGRERFANKQFLANMEKAAQRYETWIESRSPGHIDARSECNSSESLRRTRRVLAARRPPPGRARAHRQECLCYLKANPGVSPEISKRRCGQLKKGICKAYFADGTLSWSGDRNLFL